MKNILLAAAGLAASAVVAPLAAAPLVRTDAGIASTNAVTNVAAWVTHRNCAWVNNGWHYNDGKRFIVCRPPSPGPGWIWYRGEGHEGWYHKGRKEWHHHW